MKNARPASNETQSRPASAASTKAGAKPKALLSRPPKNGRQSEFETQKNNATASPASRAMKPNLALPGSPLSIVDKIRSHHRERRFAMGTQQVLDRRLESYVRINATSWHAFDDEAERKTANKEVAAKIKAARDGKGDDAIIDAVILTDKAREPADKARAANERAMEDLARCLPIAPWIETIPGLGYLGLATIIAETGDLSNYQNVAKVWKRLGYAPYNGLAGSTWKRTTWREGRPALTAEEWIANPFSGHRYAMTHVIAVWLKNKQWIGKAKTDDGVGRPNGKYGEVYAKRRAHTDTTHPDWTKGHRHMDGLRIMMKEFLKDLWIEWNAVANKSLKPKYGVRPSSPASRALKPTVAVPGSPIKEYGRQQKIETHSSGATASPAHRSVKPNPAMPGSPITKRASKC